MRLTSSSSLIFNLIIWIIKLLIRTKIFVHLLFMYLHVQKSLPNISYGESEATSICPNNAHPFFFLSYPHGNFTNISLVKIAATPFQRKFMLFKTMGNANTLNQFDVCRTLSFSVWMWALLWHCFYWILLFIIQHILSGGLIFIFGCGSVKLNYMVHYNFVHILYLTTCFNFVHIFYLTTCFVRLIFYFWLFI